MIVPSPSIKKWGSKSSANKRAAKSQSSLPNLSISCANPSADPTASIGFFEGLIPMSAPNPLILII